MMTPPVTCDSQHSLLTTRPQSCTATKLVHLTTPVSMSTMTSAICTPPTCTLERPLFSGLIDSAWLQVPVPLASFMPSAAQASFHDQLFLLALSATLPS